MAKDPMAVISAEFSRWAADPDRELSGEPIADAAEADLLLGLLRDHMGLDDPGQLNQGDLEDLLLNVYPDKVTVFDPEDTRDTIPALRDLLAFLADTGRLTDAAARRLGRELDQVAPRFADAVMDPSRWGMARSITQAMVTDGVDITDPAAVQDWIARYDESTQEALEDWDFDPEDYNLKESFGLPDWLPAMHLPAPDELAALARKSPLLAAVGRLAEWAGSDRAIDEDGELTAADTVAAAAELGIETGGPSAVTALSDVPELVHLWSLALDVGFLGEDDDGTTVAVGEAARLWHSGPDAEVLAIWSEALTFLVTDSLEIDADLDEQRGRDLDFYGAGMGLVTMLFLARSDGLPVAAAGELIREAVTGELSADEAAEAAETWAAWTQAHGEPATVLLHRLAELGAVSLDDEDEGPVARLAPLGSWAVREQLTASGVEIPLLPPPAEMTAADLVAAAEGASRDEIAAETDAWLALRDPDTAARELLDFAATADPAERVTAVTAARRLGAAAEPRWRAALDVQALRPYAKMALAELPGTSPPGLEPEPGDSAWMLIDLLATASLAFEPEELARRLAEGVPKGTAETMLDTMSRLPHPNAAEVLTLIGKHHPDKKVAKSARRFAYKANSRLKSAR